MQGRRYEPIERWGPRRGALEHQGACQHFPGAVDFPTRRASDTRTSVRVVMLVRSPPGVRTAATSRPGLETGTRTSSGSCALEPVARCESA
jgi:hypothetical protein